MTEYRVKALISVEIRAFLPGCDEKRYFIWEKSNRSAKVCRSACVMLLESKPLSPVPARTLTVIKELSRSAMTRLSF